MTDNEKAELADVYEKAAEYLEEYGWIQDMGYDRGPRCFMGAIESVDTNDWTYYTTAAAIAADALGLTLDQNSDWPTMIGYWNDDPARTEDEVINTLHALANKLR